MTVRRPLSRRRFLIGAGGVAAGAVVAGAVVEAAQGRDGDSLPRVTLPPRVDGLPARQFAWTEALARDRFGNPVAPRFDTLLFFDVARPPATRAHARLLESALRTLEHHHRWGPDGLLFTVGWSLGYFEHVLKTSSPIPRAKPLSDFELPSIDDFHACIHLACDDRGRLDAAATNLIGAIAPALTHRETRTGFTGTGLPAAHQRVRGIPGGDPVPATAPLFMGFRSNLVKNQASEDAVAIPEGPFADGTTMAVSYMRLALDSWYSEFSERERVARMYSPQTTPADVARLTTDAESEPGQINQAISRYGVIGHSQATARARRHGKPLILRRDFNTVDGGQAGLHFVSLQRTIADFVRTRNAMNAATAQLQNPSITDTVNNGINDFIFVTRRANYLIPPRAGRSFPNL